jgi:hypothetical protein
VGLETIRQHTRTLRCPAHLTKGVEDAVQHNEEWEHGLDRPECSSKSEAQDTPEKETEDHSLLAADFIHEEATNNATWEIEAVDDSPVANVLDQCVVWVQLTDEGRREESKKGM